MKSLAWKVVPGSFEFSENPLKKDPEGGNMLIWTNFHSFTITCII